MLRQCALAFTGPARRRGGVSGSVVLRASSSRDMTISGSNPKRNPRSVRYVGIRCLTVALAIAMISGCGSSDASSIASPSPIASPSSPPSPTPTTSVQQYLLTGNVSDRNTRRPVSANVELQTLAGESLGRTATDAAGYYELGMVRTGQYTLHFTAAGYDARADTIQITSNLFYGTALSPSGVTTLMLAFALADTFACVRNGTSATNVSIANLTASTVQVNFVGPVSRTLILAPSATETFSVVAGTYQSSGQSSDGKAALETAGWVLSGGCDYPLKVCVAKNNRRCMD